MIAAVVINEVHYHPVEEPEFAADGTPRLDLSGDVHEFVELYNPSGDAVRLDGWSLAGGIEYPFPSGTTIPAGGFVVIAKWPDRLRAVADYALTNVVVLGGYRGQLANEGERIVLLDEGGRVIEPFEYRPGFPWPTAADALGADAEWSGIDERDAQYTGRSLERVDPEVLADDPANWRASPWPGRPSPGRPNAARGTPRLPVAVELTVSAAGGIGQAPRPIESVKVTCVIAGASALAAVRIEWFIDDIERTDELHTWTSMTLMEESPNAVDGAGLGVARYGVELPGFGRGTVVRYRVHAVIGASSAVITPRPDDAFGWHGFFVAPVRESAVPAYALLIARASLARLEANIGEFPRRTTAPDPPGTPRASWNATEPAVFACEGRVYDVQVRHHGSRYQRQPWRQSYKVKFPRYARFEGQESLFITDKDFRTAAGHALLREAGLPTSRTRWVELSVNGAAPVLRLEQEDYATPMLERHDREAKIGGRLLRGVGDLYKSIGSAEEEGPFGRGDGRVLSGTPFWTTWERYHWTYPAQNHRWKGERPVQELIEALWRARGDAPEAVQPNLANLRRHLLEVWDVDRMLTCLAVVNWMCPWDDAFQNYYFWRQANGRWCLLPWDFDFMFGAGPLSDPGNSILAGEVGDRSNNHRGPNFIKDSFFKAFREEYRMRLSELNNRLLTAETVERLGFPNLADFAWSRRAAVNEQCRIGARVLLSEVQAQPEGTGSLVPLWVELHNRSDAVADLTGAWLRVAGEASPFLRFAAGTQLVAGGFLVVTHTGVVSLVPPLNTAGLIAGGGAIELGRDLPDRVEVLDRVQYGRHPVGWTLCRESGEFGRWRLGEATPGGANRLVATAGAQGGRINEWMADALDGVDWFELGSSGDAPLDLSWCWVTDDLSRAGHLIEPLTFLAPGSLLDFESSGSSTPRGTAVSFRLDRGGDRILLLDTGGRLLDEVAFGTQGRGVAEGRYPDVTGVVARFPLGGTRGSSNAGGGVRLAVVMARVTGEGLPRLEIRLRSPLPGTYQIEIRDTFEAGDWRAAREVRLDPGVEEVNFEEAADGKVRYYRARGPLIPAP